MRFDKENLFKELASNHGFNLYLGAGFSVYAYNSAEESLPLGNAINSRLIETFGLDSTKKYSLSKTCSKIKRDNADTLTRMLKDIYTVNTYDKKYELMLDLPISNIFTLNVDNLLERIYENQMTKVILNDTKLNGTMGRKNSVNMFKLHGSVTYPHEYEMSFTERELTDLFMRDSSLFQLATYKLSENPTIFWGISLLDNNTLDLICNSEYFSKSRIPKWIVVYPDDVNSDYIEDFEEQGFNIIEADTLELLEYLHGMDFSGGYTVKNSTKYGDKFPRNYITDKLKKVSVRRPVVDFFAGAEPQISDILSNNVTRVSYYDEVLNIILNKSTVLITGIPGCGKSTLLLQLAFSDSITGLKFWFTSITKQEAELLKELISDEERQVYVFIDNLYNNMEAFKVLSEVNNICLVVAERTLNFDYIKRSFNIDSRNIVDISELCSEDVQSICKSVNRSSIDAINLLQTNDNVSLLEIVFFAQTSSLINDRIDRYINDLRSFEDSDLKINLLELFTLINYTSFCGVPCSMDMLLFYFDDEIDSYKDVLYALQKMTNIIVQDESNSEYLDQDYLIIRSKLFAERALKLIDKFTLGNVLNRFWDNVNTQCIYRYDVFRRKAYDADITINAFDVQEGKKFYEKMYYINGTPFVKHQYAIFLLRKKKYEMAWQQIDQAYTASDKKVFTIANTHAVILFEMNIVAQADSESDLLILKESVKKSFGTLEYCITQDARINYHALVYGKNTLRYIDRFGIDEYAEKYINSSIKQIQMILEKDEYMSPRLQKRLKSLLDELKDKDSGRN